MNKYERLCTVSTSAVSTLLNDMLEDLDTTIGGFHSWTGHTDRRRVILISDYTISTLRKLHSDMVSSAYHKLTFDEKWYAESFWIRQRARSYSDPDIVLQRGDADLERLVQIDNAIKGFFASIGGALDALGTAFVGIGAINVPITEAAWSTVSKAQRWLG